MGLFTLLCSVENRTFDKIHNCLLDSVSWLLEKVEKF